MTEHEEQNQHEFSIESVIPQADLFFREHPAIEEGPPGPWNVGRAMIDFSNALLAAHPDLRGDHRIRDAVLVALLRRGIITTEAIYQLLSLGLLEPAVGLTRTLLDIEVAIKLIHADDQDEMGKRLAAYHYYAYQTHGQDMLSDRATRIETLGPHGRIPEIIEVAKQYARLLESDVFDDVREAVREDRYWHGYDSVEKAFDALGASQDYHISYDIGSWFVHAVNVDFDYAPSDDELFHLKSLVHGDPNTILPNLGVAVLGLHAIVRVYVDERGLPNLPEFQVRSRVVSPDGEVAEVDALNAVTALLLSEFNVS